MFNGQSLVDHRFPSDRYCPWETSSLDLIETTWKEKERVPFRARLRGQPDATLETAGKGDKSWDDILFVQDPNSLYPWQRSGRRLGKTSPIHLALSGLEQDVSFESLVDYVRTFLSRDDGAAIGERLRALKADTADDSETDRLSISSVLGFIRFLELNPRLRDPGVVASPSGKIRGEWHKSWQQHFVVEFLSERDAQFVIFADDPCVPGETIRLSGRCSIASLMAQAAPHGVSRWAMRE